MPRSRSVRGEDGWDLRQGDAVVLTMEASQSVLSSRSGRDADARLVGIVLERLQEDEVVGQRVWGVMLDIGYMERIFDSELEEVFPLDDEAEP